MGIRNDHLSMYFKISDKKYHIYISVDLETNNENQYHGLNDLPTAKNNHDLKRKPENILPCP